MSQEQSSTATAVQSTETSQEDSNTQAIEGQESSSDSNEQVVAEASSEADAVEKLQANNPGLSKKEAKKMIKQLKIKVDGKEYDEELPFEIPDDEEAKKYMTKQLQMSKMGQKRAQEKAQLENELVEFFNELKKNPKKALSNPNFGVDLKNLAKEIIEEEIANSNKTPEQIESEKIKAELEELKAQREREKEELRQRELARLQEQEYERYDMLMSKAIETSNLPKSPYVVKKMADYMLMGLQQGLNLTPDDVVDLVKEEIQGDIKDMFATMPEDVVEAFIGKDIINKVRKKSIAKAKGAPVPVKTAVKEVSKASKNESTKEDSKMTYKDFFKA